MSSDLLYNIGQGWLLIFITSLLYLAAELGFQLGKSKSSQFHKDCLPHVGTIEGALLGLLALLLGFAFSMSMERYDNRRQVVLGEANDLQTTYLRAALLPAAQKNIVAQLLRAYVDSRVTYLQSGRDPAVLESALKRTEAIQKELWTQALAAANQNSDEVRTGYFIESLNTLIDDHSRRIAAMENHVPEIILLLLIVVAAMTIAITGYSSGLNQVRLSVARFVLIALTSLTLIVIIDLDRPKRGFIKLNEKAMLSVQQFMAL